MKYIDYKRLQWAGRILRMDNSIMPKNILDVKLLWKKTCVKTKAERERKHQEGLLVAATYKNMEKT